MAIEILAQEVEYPDLATMPDHVQTFRCHEGFDIDAY